MVFERSNRRLDYLKELTHLVLKLPCGCYGIFSDEVPLYGERLFMAKGKFPASSIEISCRLTTPWRIHSSSFQWVSAAEHVKKVGNPSCLIIAMRSFLLSPNDGEERSDFKTWYPASL